MTGEMSKTRITKSFLGIQEALIEMILPIR